MSKSFDNKPAATPGNNSDETTDIELGEQSYKEEAVPDPNIVGWDGPDDPANPLNWPTWKKFVTISTVSFITFLSPLASTMIAPSTALFMEEFHTTNTMLGTFVTSVHLIGYALGPLVIAPMSELYGRNLLYHSCNIVFFIFNIANAVSKNMPSLIVFRLIAGVAASCPMTIGAGSIADIIPLERRGLAMAAWVLGPLFGPSIGPLSGGYISESRGWRWNFWVLSILAGVVTIISFFTLYESYAYTLLQRKTAILRKQTGNTELRSVLDTDKSPKQLFASSILRPLKMLFLSPIVFLLALYCAIIYGYLYLCFTTFTPIFEAQYGFSEGNTGLVYLGPGVGSILGLFICGGTSDRLVKALADRRNGGTPKPEYRLPVLILGAFLVPTGLFWYGWTAEKQEHWMLPIVGTGFLGAGLVTAFMPSSTYLVDTYTTYAASATAATTVFRSIIGALLPLAGSSMYDALGVGWGTSLLGFIAVAFIPLPFVFLKYGQRLRESKLFKVEF